jgi:hypothetical protein
MRQPTSETNQIKELYPIWTTIQLNELYPIWAPKLNQLHI